MTPRVSVLICTNDRPRLLERALGSLMAGTRLPDQLVVVNGGGDETNSIVARHATVIPAVTLIQYKNRNLAVSRNLGLPECHGDIIAMTDDDAIVAPTWLERIIAAHMRDPHAGAVGGPARGRVDGAFLSKIADLVVFPSFPTRRTVRTLPGVNVAYKRTAVQQIGAFDETLFRGEDVDFNWRLIRLGYDIVYDPEIGVEHEHRSTLRGLLLQQWMYGRAYVLIRRKWPDMYCVYPRQLRSARDWAKLVYCLLAVIVHPLRLAARAGGPRESVRAAPILVAHHLVWKLGMLRQALLGTTNSGMPATDASDHTLTARRWINTPSASLHPLEGVGDA